MRWLARSRPCRISKTVPSPPTAAKPPYSAAFMATSAACPGYSVTTVFSASRFNLSTIDGSKARVRPPLDRGLMMASQFVTLTGASPIEDPIQASNVRRPFRQHVEQHEFLSVCHYADRHHRVKESGPIAP